MVSSILLLLVSGRRLAELESATRKKCSQCIRSIFGSALQLKEARQNTRVR
jgi:hypothetical protein